MFDKKYKLRFLPIFYRDLSSVVSYIANELNSPLTAKRFIDEVERAINQRLKAPESFEQYKSVKDRLLPYYRIKVKNYFIFYVVIDDYMEVRRLIYSRRSLPNII